MTAQTPTQIADGLDRASDAAFAALGNSMSSDAPAGARSAWSATQQAIMELRGAESGAAGIRALEQEAAQHTANGLEEAARAVTLRADSARVNLTAAIGSLSDRALATLAVVEAECRLALIPPPLDAPGSSLARQELSEATQGKTGVELALALANLVGQAPDLDAELLGPWTRRRIAAANADPRSQQAAQKSFDAIAQARLLDLPPRSRGQAQAVAALRALDRARGAVAAVRSSVSVRAGLR